MKANEWTCKQQAKLTLTEIDLALSLVCYISGDDANLTREQFLGIVRDRIDDDLKYGTI